MNIRITACADLHIGKTFMSYPIGIREKLVEARLCALDNLVRIANEKNSHLFLIAGDLFDSTSVSEHLIQRTLRILQTFRGNAVLVVPGNHDHSDTAQTDLWERVKKEHSDILFVFEKPGRYPLQEFIDLPVLIYALPCTNLHGKESLTRYVHHIKEDEEKLCIGLGHGTVLGMTPDTYGQYFPKTTHELQLLHADFWIIGHAHVVRPQDKQGGPEWVLFPGSPEPDGFDHLHPGSAWFLEASEKGIYKKETLSPGSLHFAELSMICTENTIDDLERKLLPYNPAVTLLRIKLEGFVSKDFRENWIHFKDRLQRDFLYIELDEKAMKNSFDKKVLDEFPEQSFPFLLLAYFLEEKKDEELSLAYQLIQETCKQ